MSSNELIILKELEKLLVSENPNDKSVISLFDLSKLMNSKHIELCNLKKNYQIYLEDKLNNEFDIKLYFNYKKGILILKLNHKDDIDYKTIIFSKTCNELIMQNKESKFNTNIMMILKQDLITIYNEFSKYNDYMLDEIYFKKTKNSKFEFTLYNSCIFINLRNDMGLLDNFDLTYYNNSNSYETYSNSNDIINLITGNENKIFKNIFVNIKDCPKWSRTVLYHERKKQIENYKQKNLKIN